MMKRLILCVLLIPVFSPAASAAESDLGSFMQRNKINSIGRALDWERDNIRYEAYSGYRWQSAESIINSRKSCCQGFASINYEFLKRLGFDPAIYSFQVGMGVEATQHAVVIFKNDGYFNAISNHELVTSQETDIRAFLYDLGLDNDYHFPVKIK